MFGQFSQAPIKSVVAGLHRRYVVVYGVEDLLVAQASALGHGADDGFVDGSGGAAGQVAYGVGADH